MKKMLCKKVRRIPPPPRNTKEWFLSVCPYECTWLSLAPAWFDEFDLYSLLKSLSISGRCPVNLNILASK